MQQTTTKHNTMKMINNNNNNNDDHPTQQAAFNVIGSGPKNSNEANHTMASKATPTLQNLMYARFVRSATTKASSSTRNKTNGSSPGCLSELNSSSSNYHHQSFTLPSRSRTNSILSILDQVDSLFDDLDDIMVREEESRNTSSESAASQ